jgi:hypothetical protein
MKTFKSHLKEYAPVPPKKDGGSSEPKKDDVVYMGHDPIVKPKRTPQHPNKVKKSEPISNKSNLTGIVGKKLKRAAATVAPALGVVDDDTPAEKAKIGQEQRIRRHLHRAALKNQDASHKFHTNMDKVKKATSDDDPIDAFGHSISAMNNQNKQIDALQTGVRAAAGISVTEPPRFGVDQERPTVKRALANKVGKLLGRGRKG